MILFFQISSLFSLIILIIGLFKPKWILFWMKNPEPFYVFVLATLLFMGSFAGLGIASGARALVVFFQAMIALSILVLIVGLINPKWVLFRMRKPDRFYILVIATLLFMGSVTGLGMALGAKGKRDGANAGARQNLSRSSPKGIVQN